MKNDPQSTQQAAARSRLGLLLGTAITAAIGLGACVQMPTETQGEVDLHARISFDIQSERGRQALVRLDSLDVGRAGDYPAGSAALQVLPGTHHLQLLTGGETILDERFYIGDGVQRTFIAR